MKIDMIENDRRKVRPASFWFNLIGPSVGFLLWLATSLIQWGAYTQRMNSVEARIVDLQTDVRAMQQTLMERGYQKQ